MAATDLDTELRRAAESTAQSILSAAREEAEGITSEAVRQIEDKRSALVRDKEAEYGALARAAVAAEKHEALRTVLVAQTELVERVLGRARALLPKAVNSEAYLSELGPELDEALQFFQGGSILVRCSTALEAAAREALRGRADVSVEAGANTGTGFVVIGGGGSVLVDGRLESRIDRLAPSLAIEIHRRLGEP